MQLTLNVVYLPTKKNDEVNNLWIKRIDEVDMLHAKIYYNYLMLVG
jgi:hypothetical protein